jgi:protein involved in polysaccharide export with SLBB domain
MRIVNITLVFLLGLLTLPSLSDPLTYEVQIGDMLQISLPGESSLKAPFTIDRQGRIILPEVGELGVAGKSLQQVQTLVREKLREIYLDLDKLTVYLHKKQLLIGVRGYVSQPGQFTLQADSSVQMAIHAAGGLRKGAQLDRVQLIRNKSTQVFNYKKYLDSGDSNLLPVLKSMDALFIPASPMTGNVEVDFDPSKVADSGDAANSRLSVKVFGEVNRSGSFSYREEMTIVDLLMRAGGVTRYAGVEKIRVIAQKQPVIFNLKQYLDSGDVKYLPSILPGATVFVPRQEEEIKTGAHMVYVMGEVAHPGAYEGNAQVTLMDILANAGGPTRFAESRSIRIIKHDNTIIPFDLTAFTEGNLIGNMPQIAPGDAVFVPEKVDMNEKSWLKVSPKRAVRVIGAVQRPGRIEWSDEMSLLDLLAHVGGPTARADTDNIELVIPQQEGGNVSLTFNLNTFIKQALDDAELPKISAGTTVFLQELPQDPANNKSQWVRQASHKSIYIFGQVGAPGRYRFTSDMNFLDLLSAADGPTQDADLRNIRINHRDNQNKGVSRLDLALYFETGDDALIPTISTGDTIYIPEKDRVWLDHSKESTVRVLGAVNKPGRYRFDDTMTLLDLLAQAGGANAQAHIQNITVVNLSCCKNQARSFDLSNFSQNASFDDLPVLRAGDTVYIPYQSESRFNKLREGLGDIVRIVAFAALFGGI